MSTPIASSRRSSVRQSRGLEGRACLTATPTASSTAARAISRRGGAVRRQLEARGRRRLVGHRRPLPRQIRALRIAVRGEGGEGHYSEASEALHYPCYNRGCHGGGLDLYAKVCEMAERLETRFQGEMSCHGHESMGRLLTKLPSRVHRRHLRRVRRFMILPQRAANCPAPRAGAAGTRCPALRPTCSGASPGRLLHHDRVLKRRRGKARPVGAVAGRRGQR
jgi:hypothetical protein